MFGLVSSIFAAKSLAISIATYFQIVENVDSKIDKLTKKEFDSALSLLKQAQSVTSPYIYNQILITAIDRFNQAIVLEERDRLLLSYLGLMMCYFYLGERSAIIQVQDTVRELKFSRTFWEKNGGEIKAMGVGLLGILMAVAGGASAGAGVAGSSSTGRKAQEDSEASIKAKENLFNELRSVIANIRFS